MKKTNTVAPKAKSVKATTKSNTKKDKDSVTLVNDDLGATEKVKPRTGRGLANEGTVVSYDEER